MTFFTNFTDFDHQSNTYHVTGHGNTVPGHNFENGVSERGDDRGDTDSSEHGSGHGYGSGAVTRKQHQGC